MSFPLTTYVKRIASADQGVRREAVLHILDELGVSFVQHQEHTGKHQPENIVVSFHQALSRYVIGAHYDSVVGSTGANDNAAGVSILLKLAAHYCDLPPPIPLDIVFFDLEEVGMLGSRTYIDRVKAENILGAVNFDVCGVGDTVVVAPHHRAHSAPFTPALDHLKGRYTLIEQMPPGDDVSFDTVGIPNLSVCALPFEEVDLLAEAGRALHQMDAPEALPPILETMHNGPRDRVDVVTESAMEMVLNWAQELVHELGTNRYG
jgi:hypothetical protein